MIGRVGQFWRITRELDLSALRQEFDRQVPLLVLGSDSRSAGQLGDLLSPGSRSGTLHVASLDDWSSRETTAPTEDCLILIAVGGGLTADGSRALTVITRGEAPFVLVRLPNAPNVLLVGGVEAHVISLDPGSEAEGARKKIVEALLRLAPGLLLPLGRSTPVLRPTIARSLIQESARANAQFAALSSLPSNLPLIGGLVGGAADLLVLTKNQVVLLFKLSGLYGRDLALGQELLVELLPVVGGAFVWRSAARSLVGLVPSAVALLPKTLIAYSGTVVVGEIARYYFEHGRRPPEDYLRDLQAESLRAARKSLSLLTRGRDQNH